MAKCPEVLTVIGYAPAAVTVPPNVGLELNTKYGPVPVDKFTLLEVTHPVVNFEAVIQSVANSLFPTELDAS